MANMYLLRNEILNENQYYARKPRVGILICTTEYNFIRHVTHSEELVLGSFQMMQADISENGIEILQPYIDLKNKSHLWAFVTHRG